MDNYDPSSFRQEQKYLISTLNSAELKIRLSHLMNVDANADSRGFYHVSSLYFDDYGKSCYYDNENGNEPREKFRIRKYNDSNDYFALEHKRKRNGLTFKQTCSLTQEQVQILINGRCVPDFENQPPLLKKLTLQMRIRGLHPVIIVDYDREPFTYRNGNVRVTFDRNVSFCSYIDRFLTPQKPLIPVMSTGSQILEVKYGRFLPDEIFNTLQLDGIQRTAFSKYYLCRKFSELNN